jgi:two-component system response regulator CpxR
MAMPDSDVQRPSRSNRILIIDDDRDLCWLIHDYLEPLGYEVICVHDGLQGLQEAQEHEFDAIVLDIMLPAMDGLEVLRRLRAQSDVPVLMLTARGEEPDRIVGLELGADDYLPKTFSTRELLARLRAVTRRTGRRGDAADEEEPPIVVGDLHIHPDSRTAVLGDRPLQLTPLEFDLLACLAQARGRVKTREQLIEAVADRKYEIFDRSIDVHISSLRRKLGDNPRKPRYIRTYRSVGYMFIRPGDSATP